MLQTELWVSVYSLPVAAAVLYAAYGSLIVRGLRTPQATVGNGLRYGAILAFVLHLMSVAHSMYVGEDFVFGFGLALSVMFLAAAFTVIVESYFHRITVQMGAVLLLAAPAVLMPLVFKGSVIANATFIFRHHLFAAMISYGFIAVAVVQALLLMRLQKKLKTPSVENLSVGVHTNVPDLMAMHRILYRIVVCAFVALTAVLVLGALATFELRGTYFVFDHKTLLSWLSWVVFAVLIVGRECRFWSMKRFLTVFWIGVSLEFAAYLVYRFVIEVLR